MKPTMPSTATLPAMAKPTIELCLPVLTPESEPSVGDEDADDDVDVPEGPESAVLVK
jgi:hypothetical protein